MSKIDPDIVTVASGLDHPEGIALGPNGMLYAGGEAGQVYRIDPDARSHEQIADTGGSILGVCLDASGAVYACDPGNRAVMRIDSESGEVDRWCDAAAGTVIRAPNWAAFSPDGWMWLSDSGSEELEARDGRLLRVPASGGDAEVIETGPLHFPNGLCVGPDNLVYWVESYTPQFRRLGAGGPELVAALPGVVPDGVVLDAEGGFVICCYYPYRLLRVPPASDTPVVFFDDPLARHFAMPTNGAYFGDEMRQLAVASLGGQSVKALRTSTPGAQLHYP